jgi:hypothetical protein
MNEEEGHQREIDGTHNEFVSRATQDWAGKPEVPALDSPPAQQADPYGGFDKGEDYRLRQFEVNIIDGEPYVNGGSVIYREEDTQIHKILTVLKGPSTVGEYIYAAHTATSNCIITTEFIGDADPEKPDEIGEDDEDSIYYTKLAKIDGPAIIEQYIDGPIWLGIVMPCEDSSSSEESSVESSSEESSVESSSEDSSGDLGSDSKDTAIVKCSKHPEGNAAFYCREHTGVIFDDDFKVKVSGRKTRAKIDPYYLECLEERSAKVLVSGDTGWAAGYVKDGYVIITTSFLPWCRPKVVMVMVTGPRLGFKDTRMEPRTDKQRMENNERLRNNYTPNEINKRK